MAALGASDAASAWRRFFRRRRSRVLLALVLLAVVTRIALPTVVRRVVVARADEALVGRVELDDGDLSLLTAGFTLHGLRVFSTEASAPDAPASAAPEASPAPQAGEGPPGSAPVLSVDRLVVDLGLRALLHKIVEVRRIELADVAVSLDRGKDGALVLPAAVPAAEPTPVAEGAGWGVLIQSVALRNGRIGFRDFAVGDPPQHVEVTLPTLDAGQLALLITQSGVEPGKVALDAGIQDGTLHLEATLETLPAGPAYESHVVLTHVPIADSRLYLPKVGWSALTGRLDADLVHRFESQGAHTVRGSVALRDLDVRVAELDDPALAWQALAVEGADVDLVAQHVALGTVTLDGARVVTRPGGPEPLPVLHGLLAAATGPDAAPPPSSPPPTAPTVSASPVATAPTPAENAPTTAAPSAAGVGGATVDAASPRPWTWNVAKVLVRDANVHAIGGDGPLDVGVAAEAAPLSSTAGAAANVRVTLASSAGGTLELAGALTPAPLAFDGTLRTQDLRLAALTLPVATGATRLLKNGIANLDLAIAAGATPKAPIDGVQLSGTIALGDLDIAGEDPTKFGLRWQRLAVAVSALVAPGVLAPGRAAAPIDAAFTSIALVRPDITVTRVADGIALPSALAAGGTAAAPPPPPAPPGATTVPEPRPEGRVRADRLTIEKLRLVTNDTTVKPFFRSVLDPVDLSAAAVVWPDPAAKDVKLVAKSADGAVLTVTGNVAPARTRLAAKLAGLPLAPFNPYAVSTGYGVAGGTAQLESTITIEKGGYDTKSRLVLNGLDVRGGEGDALFASKFGMPLSLALSLLTDLQGNIVLDLPIAGDARGTRTGVGTLVGNALARAILNAVTSPLKLIGAVARIGDKPTALTPPPLAFLPGRVALADGEAEKLAPLASLLAKAPGLRLHLRGEVGDLDRRWLREQALRAKLEQESGGLGAVRHIAERAVRKEVLRVLTARAAGTPTEVPAEHQAWFEAQVAAQDVDAATLRELASARAAMVQAKLASGEGVAAERVVLDEVLATNPAARSAVAVGLGSPAPLPAAP